MEDIKSVTTEDLTRRMVFSNQGKEYINGFMNLLVDTCLTLDQERQVMKYIKNVAEILEEESHAKEGAGADFSPRTRGFFP